MEAGYLTRTMSPDEVALAVEWAAQEGWNPGLHDDFSFHAADPGGFLPDQTVPQTEILITPPCFHVTDAELRGHIISICNGLSLICGEDHFERRAFGFHHPLCEASNDL